ncbi:MAG: tRNA (adenosine(37)-N6)-threonylcarbamoyltransferase complex dimerization subunit type 1 TsaB [Methylovulum sp.]|nr:tRNA (adenosine(37)-N6)-threonylcarbamoyltransferase complex dimerization subunit type 1 TsaB [Methylovulum sp.]
MKLLAVETATEACSAALAVDGVISERYAIAGNTHSRLILPMIDGLITEAGLSPGDLDGLAFGCGPGSFTGVRIATGVIQGIAFGLDLPVVPVSTLRAIAQDYFDGQDKHHGGTDVALVAMDARMGEIFWGVYQRNDDGFAELVGQEAVAPATDIVCPDRVGVGLGSAWGVYRDELMTRLAGRVSAYQTDHLPRARAIARLGLLGFRDGSAVPVEQAMPVYLRDNVAKKESERKKPGD